MGWIKKGRLFVPSGRIPWMKTHAAVPFAEPLGGSLFRVYFSSRDATNRSHTGFVELDMLRPDRILRISTKPVLAPGPLGTFDEDGAMLSWITPSKGRRNLYYIGWNLGVSVPFRNAIGLAVGGEKGTHFKRLGPGPILDRGLDDPYFTASSCVLKVGAVWRMWYLSCSRWTLLNGRPKHWYHLKYAESSDGIHWVRRGLPCITYRSNREYAISRPSVLRVSSGYEMWYSHRGGRYRIGYAESRDGIHWVRKDTQGGLSVSSSGWDSEMVEYPHVFLVSGQKHMLYNGNGYGKTGFGLAVWED